MGAALILASGSPRRRALLAQVATAFEVEASDVPETPLPGEAPEAFARRAAWEKAATVAARHPSRCVLGADTIVVVDGVAFGKPVDREDACRMLRTLSGRAHRVLTAVALIQSGNGGPDAQYQRPGHQLLVESQVVFRPLADAEIEAYVDSGEPFDKAGAYAVQGLAHAFIRAVRGSRSNVIGLPVDEVAALLRQCCPEALGRPAVGA